MYFFLNQIVGCRGNDMYLLYFTEVKTIHSSSHRKSKILVGSKKMFICFDFKIRTWPWCM